MIRKIELYKVRGKTINFECIISYWKRREKIALIKNIFFLYYEKFIIKVGCKAVKSLPEPVL
jgi:hypothetical protein